VALLSAGGGGFTAQGGGIKVGVVSDAVPHIAGLAGGPQIVGEMVTRR
jgi:hypothetical protein